MPDWPKPSIKEDRGSVAAETILNSPITFGLDEEGVRRVLQEELVRLARQKGVPVAPLQAVLAKLGEIGVPEALRRNHRGR